MEYQGTLDSDMGGALGITAQSKNFMMEAAKWAKFLGIVGFVGIGLMVLAGIFLGTFMGSLYDQPGMEGISAVMGGGFFTIIYLVLAALYFFPVLYMYKYAVKTQQSLRSNDTMMLQEAFENLKSMFKFWGIFTAIILGFYAIMIVIGLVGGAFAAF